MSFRRLTQALPERLDEILPGVYGDKKTGYGRAQLVKRMGITAGGGDQAVLCLPAAGLEIFSDCVSAVVGFNDRTQSLLKNRFADRALFSAGMRGNGDAACIPDITKKLGTAQMGWNLLNRAKKQKIPLQASYTPSQ